jgi:hypothetical protein
VGTDALSVRLIFRALSAPEVIKKTRIPPLQQGLFMREEDEVYSAVCKYKVEWQRSSRFNTSHITGAILDLDARGATQHVGIKPEHFLTRLPPKVRVSATIKTDEESRSGDVPLAFGAYTFPWISLDGPVHRNAIILDVDHADGLELAQELPPHIRPHIVMDPWSGHSAAIFMLDDPHYVGDGASDKSRNFFDIQSMRLAQYFRATVLPHGSLTKNPFGSVEMLQGKQVRRIPEPGTAFRARYEKTGKVEPTSPWWHVWEHLQSEFVWLSWPGARHIDLYCVKQHFERLEVEGEALPPRLTRHRWRGVPDQRGRNCELFDTLRWWCYDNAEKDLGTIMWKGDELNSLFPTPLPHSEVAATARSIAKYMRARWRPRKPKKAALTTEQVKERRVAAGQRSADLKAAKSMAVLTVTLCHWPEDEKLTKIALARRAGVSIDTVKRAWAKLVA